jgi:hypothetical protein
VIPAALHAATLERLRTLNPDTRRQHTTRDVAAWLRDVHGLSVHAATVGRLQAAAEKYTDSQVVAAIREELRETIAPTRRKLSRALVKLDQLVAQSDDPKAVAAAVNATTRALHELAVVSGVAAPVSVDLTTNGRPINLRWADEAPDDHAPAAPSGTAGGGP